MKTQVLKRLNKLTNWQAALIITMFGFLVYCDSLKNQFLGDDGAQIVNNPVVHSLAHLKLLFEGGTFYVGKGMVPLAGVYFRPLMMTVFSLIYTVFGPHPFYFHLIQLLLCIGSTILLYLFFRYPFRPALALFLALVFLVHPIDAQTVFAIASMQDALFFFFGMLALYLLVKSKSNAGLAGAATCLFLSLLAKETGILFIIIALLYLLWFGSKRRALLFAGIVTVPIAIYLVLKIQAIGFLGQNPQNTPIDFTGLGGRLLTVPSVIMFYFDKFIFPWRLASSYYWVHARFSVGYFLLPLSVDLLIIAVAAYLAIVIKLRGTRSEFYTYVFFVIWLALGLIVHLQVIPLDMTATYPWFYFSMAGLLGMLGIVWSVLRPRIRPDWLLVAIAVIVLGILCVRTAAWGRDWSSDYQLFWTDIHSSNDNFAAYNLVATHYMQQGRFAQAQYYAQKSVDVFPSFGNYNNLGLSLSGQGNYAGAIRAYDKGLTYSSSDQIYEGIGELALVYGNPTTDRLFLIDAVQRFPEDSSLWMYLAILEDRQGDSTDAKIAIQKAAMYGQVPQALYSPIMTNQSLKLNLPDLKDTITIK